LSGSGSLRRVVATNEVHIVQTAGKATSYGKDTVNGNSYCQLLVNKLTSLIDQTKVS